MSKAPEAVLQTDVVEAFSVRCSSSSEAAAEWGRSCSRVNAKSGKPRAGGDARASVHRVCWASLTPQAPGSVVVSPVQRTGIYLRPRRVRRRGARPAHVVRRYPP